MRFHVGAGAVYLREWVNVDLPLSSVFLAKERPDLVEAWATTEDAYYARHENKTYDVWRKGPQEKQTVCDVYGSFAFLPARDKSVSEILARQCFEHLSVDKAIPALQECRRVLKWGGTLRLDVPDPEKTLELYRETGDEFWKRHLFGPRQNQWGFHTFYDRSTMIRLAADAGFNYVGEEPNIHDKYPAFCVRFTLS